MYPEKLNLTGNAKRILEIDERVLGNDEYKEVYDDERDAWDGVWISMCWSSPLMDSVTWREKMLNMSFSNVWLLHNVIEYASYRRFLIWFGLENFKNNWPIMRGYCTRRLFHERVHYDVLWSAICTDLPQTIPVLPKWQTLDKIERKFLILSCDRPGRTLDYIAEHIGISWYAAKEILDLLVAEKFLNYIANKIWKNQFFLTFQYPRPIVRRVLYHRNGECYQVRLGPEW